MSLFSFRLSARCVILGFCVLVLGTGCPDNDLDPVEDAGVVDMNAARDMPATNLDAGSPKDDGAALEPDMAREDMNIEAEDAGVDMSRDMASARDMAGDMPSDQGDMQSPTDMPSDMTQQDAGLQDMIAADAGSSDDQGVDMALDAGMPDLGSDLGMDMASDMGPAMCGLAAPSCFVNDDCTDASTRCEADASGIACCMPGMRGTDPPGTPCIDGNACDSSLCIGDGAGGLTYCSKLCASDNDCPTTLPRCNAAFAVCIPAN